MQIYEGAKAGADSTDIGWNWRSVGSVILLVSTGVFGMLVMLQLFVFLTGIQVERSLTSPVMYSASAAVPLLMLLGVYLFAARHNGWAALGMRAASAWVLLATPILFVVDLVGMAFINIIIAQIRGEQFENPQMDMLTSGALTNPGTVIMLFVLLAVLVPIAEELFFRGMLYPLMRQRWGVVAALFGSAAIFGALHFLPILFPALMFLGLILAFLREWSGSVLPCILLHMMQNGFVVLALAFLSSSA